MKKNLIALAVVAASGAASAQSSVLLYGLVDVYVGSIKTPTASGGSVTQSVLNGGGINNSKFGLTGSEDLGGGLKANFLLEGDFDVSTGVSGTNRNFYTGTVSGSVFNNGSYVGLSGDFGEVQLGRMVTSFDDAKGLGAAGFNANIFSPAAFVWASNNYADKPGNSVKYMTPRFGGLSANVSYSFGENKTDTTHAGKVVSANVGYQGGPLVAMLSYQTEQPSGNDTTAKFLQFNTTYDLGVVKLRGAYGSVKDKVATIDKTNEYQLGLDIPVGSFLTLSTGYAWSKDDVIAGSAIERKGFGFAAMYYLSKRTSVYGGFNDSKLEVPGAPDGKTRVIAVGLRHTF